jgi:hypothetical protein
MKIFLSSGIISTDSLLFTYYNFVIVTLRYLVIISVGYIAKQLVLVCVKYIKGLCHEMDWIFFYMHG